MEAKRYPNTSKQSSYKNDRVHLFNAETNRPACGKSSIYRDYSFAKNYHDITCQHCLRKIDGIVKEAQRRALEKANLYIKN